jgi:DNA-binding CsgD family transcriptional regulator
VMTVTSCEMLSVVMRSTKRLGRDIRLTGGCRRETNPDKSSDVVAAVYRRSSYRYLSPQQEQVAQMLAKGYSNKAIAINLDCCLTTAQKETHYVVRKYGASNRTMAALMIAGVLPAKGLWRSWTILPKNGSRLRDMRLSLLALTSRYDP